MIALTLPHFKPLTKKSPFLSVPDVTIMLATGPLPVSIFDSKTIPVAFESKSVFRSKISAWRIIASEVYNANYETEKALLVSKGVDFEKIDQAERKSLQELFAGNKRE